MKLHDFIKYRGFVVCRGVLTKGDTFINPNRSGAGEYNQLFYVVLGGGFANDLPLTEEGSLYDLSQFKDQEIVYTSTAPASIWIAFNPLIKDTHLNVRIINQPTSETVQHDTLETFIVPIEGNVEVNGKTLETFKSGRLLIGRTADLTVPEGSVCALVNVVRD